MKEYINTMPSSAVWVKPTYPHAQLPYVTQEDVDSTPLMQCLYKALSMRRAPGSQTEAQFVAWMCNRLPVTMVDEAGNIHIDTRDGPQHRTMITAHTDTVHNTGGVNKIRLDVSDPNAITWRADEGACLGADDGAGVALIYHMIVHGFKGYAILFRQEEVGGVGSQWLAKNMPKLLKDIDRCVSLDRAGKHDVITHQCGTRCCSDEFANALAKALTTEDLSLAFTPDSTGVFTDSANLTELISECTNLSIGYKHQHGDGEWQDVTFLVKMAAQLCLVPWDDLPVKRDPLADDREDWSLWSTGKDGSTSQYKNAYGKGAKGSKLPFDVAMSYEMEILIDALWDAHAGSYIEIKQLVAEYALPENPDEAYPFINPFAIKPAIYEAYAQGLETGEYEYQTVLDNLYDDMVFN